MIDSEPHSSTSSSDEDDWFLVSESESEDLDATFHFVPSSEFETAHCSEGPPYSPVEELRGVTADDDRAGTVSKADLDRHQEEEEGCFLEATDGCIAREDEEAGKEEKNDNVDNNCDFRVQEDQVEESAQNYEENLLHFHENHFTIQEENSTASEEDLCLNLEIGSNESVGSGEHEISEEDELATLIEEERRELTRICAKVKESDNFWTKYESWDTKPNMVTKRRKHKFFPKIYRLRIYDDKVYKYVPLP